MGHGRAKIDSPEVIREFRGHYAAFDNACRNALTGLEAEVKETLRWLTGEQLMFCKGQLRKREDAVIQAQSEYRKAQWSSFHKGRTTGVEEKKALDLAVRKKEESEERLAAVKKWTLYLQQSFEKIYAPCRSLAVTLDQTTPAALGSLDKLMERLEEYFRSSPGDAS